MRTIYFSLILIALIFSGCNQPTANEGATLKSTPVELAPVEHELISIPIRSSGIISTSDEIKLSFKTGGIVARTYVKEGMSIKKGQLLASLNTTEINAHVAQARSMYEKARRDFERAEALYNDSVATLEMKQNAETALNVSLSILEAAEFNRNYSEIRAPKDGIILKEIVHESELIAPGYPIYVMGVKGGDWVLRSGLSDRDMVKVQLGDTALVHVDAWPNDEFIAIVSQRAEVPDLNTGTYEVELQLNQTNRHLATGFVAKLEIFPARRDSFYLVPVDAVVDINGHEAYVFVPDANMHAKKVKVTIVTLINGQAVISNGLDGVNHVISAGSSYLKNDDLITVKTQIR